MLLIADFLHHLFCHVCAVFVAPQISKLTGECECGVSLITSNSSCLFVLYQPLSNTFTYYSCFSVFFVTISLPLSLLHLLMQSLSTNLVYFSDSAQSLLGSLLSDSVSWGCWRWLVMASPDCALFSMCCETTGQRQQQAAQASQIITLIMARAGLNGH